MCTESAQCAQCIRHNVPVQCANNAQYRNSAQCAQLAHGVCRVNNTIFKTSSLLKLLIYGEGLLQKCTASGACDSVI